MNKSINILHRVSCCLAAGLLALVFSSCSDHWDDFTPTHNADDSTAICFNATVVGSRLATRANNTLVNRLESQFPAAAVSNYQIGIFGSYTGQKTWAGYKTANSAEPANNLFYNQPADIAAFSSGSHTLTYSPLRFWPNTIVEGAADPAQREYCSFWSYYPYNASSDPGTYGVSIVPTNTNGYAVDKGMGSIKFTMQPDAANQTDFLVSDLMADCSRTAYPLVKTEDSYEPTRVPFTFHHMLAQVRLYTIIKGADKIVYASNDDKVLTVSAVTAGTSVTLTDGTNSWVCTTTTAETKDAYGNTITVAVGDNVPDDTSWLHADIKPATVGTVRWKRTAEQDQDNNYFADFDYSVTFNNIHTSGIFTPTYDTATGETTFSSAVNDFATGSATVNNYIQNKDWFTFDGNNQRVMLDDNHMFDYDAGNIILAVPQVLTDDDVPHVIVNVAGTRTVWNSSTSAWEDGEAVTAKVTVNMLNMKIKWESGFIYCYAFLDELMPGDDKVRGPETITVVFDPDQHTDQW